MHFKAIVFGLNWFTEQADWIFNFGLEGVMISFMPTKMGLIKFPHSILGYSTVVDIPFYRKSQKKKQAVKSVLQR